jgi:hypothetical protein
MAGDQAMTDPFLRDHMAGVHQPEIEAMMMQIEPILHGHSRALNIIVFTRLIAVMLGPAQPATREKYFAAIVPTLRQILDKMDEFMRQRNENTQ